MFPPADTTIRDVAEAAGVSIASVSLAFRHPHRLKSGTRDTIYRVARELGYRPNLAASILRSRRPGPNSLTRNLGVAFITAEQTPKVRRGTTLYQRSAQARAETLGYGFQRFDLALEPPPRHFLSVLRARGVVGVMFGPNYQPALLEGFEWQTFPGVCLGGYPAPEGFPRVRSDPYLQVFLAWEELWGRGFRRIGAVLFHHEPWLDDDRQRLGAYLSAQLAGGVAAPIPPLLGSPVGAAAFRKWFEEHRPEAVIDFLSWIPERLRELGVRVPGECALVSLYDPGLPAGEIAQVCEDYEGIGSAAFALLDQMLRHHEIGLRNSPEDVRIPPTWVEGASVPPVASKTRS